MKFILDSFLGIERRAEQCLYLMGGALALCVYLFLHNTNIEVSFSLFYIKMVMFVLSFVFIEMLYINSMKKKGYKSWEQAFGYKLVCIFMGFSIFHVFAFLTLGLVTALIYFIYAIFMFMIPDIYRWIINN